MFVIRNLTHDDLEDVFELSSLQVFINLPNDRGALKKIITKSLDSFKSPKSDLWENYYVFGLEDCETSKIIGVSMIHAQHGTEDEPHFYLRVGHENKYSKTINTGFVHGTLRLGLDTNGPTEIGGLVLSPAYRGNDGKLGKQLSFSRFLYMSMYPDHFKPVVHSELMPPFDSSGKSPLWEAVGRRFMNMDYIEADMLSRNNKEFILSLFPADNIYQTLLPLNARNAIGKVGKQTEPVKRMLESIGFEYTDEVDPFDGGPHYRCKLSEIHPIKNAISGELNFVDSLDEETPRYIISIPTSDYQFFATTAPAILKDEKICLLKNEKLEKSYAGGIANAIPLNKN
jgi:arginine N-succinyltransferase